MGRLVVKILATFFLYNIYIITVDSQLKCDSDKCYRSVNTTHKKLLELIDRLNTTVKTAKIPQFYDFDTYFNDLRKIVADTKKIKARLDNHNQELGKFQREVSRNEKTVKKMEEKLFNVSKFLQETNSTILMLNNITKRAEEYNQEVKDLAELNKNVSKTCENSYKAFMQLETAVNETDKTYKRIKSAYNNTVLRAEKINKNLRETLQEAVRNKNETDKLKIPSSALDNYVKESEIKFNRSITYLKENADILRQLLEELHNSTKERVEKTIQEVNNTLAKIQDDLKTMNEKIDEFNVTIIRDNFNVTVDNETKKLVSDVEKAIEQLENRLKVVDFTENEKNLLRKEFSESVESLHYKIQKLINYIALIKILPTNDQKLREIEEEIDRLKKSIALTRQYQELKKELEHLRKLRDELIKSNCKMCVDCLT